MSIRQRYAKKMLGNQGSTAAPTSLFNTSKSSGRKQRTGENKRTKYSHSKHSRFMWFDLRAYIHGGKGGVYSLPVERDYILQRYRHSFIAEESMIDSNSQTWHPSLRSP